MESPRVVPGRDAEFLGGLPPEVVNTITSAKAPSTRHAYRLNSNLFVDWCSSRQEDPRRCPIRVVLFFLQDGLERRLSPSTLKVYFAAIPEQHDAVDSKSVGKHDLVIRFLRGARKLNPPRPHLVPFWNLPSVLATMKGRQKQAENDQPGLNEELVPKRGTTSVAWSRVFKHCSFKTTDFKLLKHKQQTYMRAPSLYVWEECAFSFLPTLYNYINTLICVRIPIFASILINTAI